VPHPFDKLRGETLGERALMEILDELDFIEVLNSRVTFSGNNRRAQEFARSRGLLSTAGSDAHSSYELGRAYVEMPPFNSREEFLESLAKGRIVGSLSPLWVHFFSVYARLRRLAKG
jgi:predicted metal-dependent phosphoesterase TrpH